MVSWDKGDNSNALIRILNSLLEHTINYKSQ